MRDEKAPFHWCERKQVLSYWRKCLLIIMWPSGYSLFSFPSTLIWSGSTSALFQINRSLIDLGSNKQTFAKLSKHDNHRLICKGQTLWYLMFRLCVWPHTPTHESIRADSFKHTYTFWQYVCEWELPWRQQEAPWQTERVTVTEWNAFKSYSAFSPTSVSAEGVRSTRGL